MNIKTLGLTCVAGAVGLISSVAVAADYKKNPFTLAYDGAITENAKGAVNITPVKYKLDGLDIVANVYTPANYSPARKYPAIVVAHPNGGVKEQVAGLYAQRLADQGYIAIAADAAYQGGSGGQPRYVDKPANRVEDIHGMADFLSQYAGVDAARIGLLGICGGGGYSLKAAQSDKRFKSVATLSMFNSGRVRRNGYMDSQLDTVQERLRQASDARARQAAGGEAAYANTAKLTDEQHGVLRQDALPPELLGRLHHQQPAGPDELGCDRQHRPDRPAAPDDGRQQRGLALHVAGSHGKGHRHEGQGAVPDRRRDAHRNVLEARVREPGGGQAEGLLRPYARRQRGLNVGQAQSPNAMSELATARIGTPKLVMSESVALWCARICAPVACGLSCEVCASAASTTS